MSLKRYSLLTLLAAFAAVLAVVLPGVHSGTVNAQSRFGWSAVTSGTQQHLHDVHFVDASNGWAVGWAGTVLRTSDGGDTWSLTRSGGSHLWGVDFVDASNGWAVGSSGNIIRTSDGGATWSGQTSRTFRNLYAVDFVSASRGWAVGDQGTILHTTNGGATWSAQSAPNDNILRDVHFVNASNGVAVGYSATVLRTTNGGATWTQVSNTGSNILFNVDFIDASNGWASGFGGTILHTTDGGATWSAQNSGFTTNTNLRVDFADANNGWAVGPNGDIVGTTDGGATWRVHTSGTTENLRGVHAFSGGRAVAVGRGGTILAYEPPPLIELSLFHQCCIYEERGRQQLLLKVALGEAQTQDVRVSMSWDLGETADDFESFEVPDVTVPAGWEWISATVTAVPRDDDVGEQEKKLTVTATVGAGAAANTASQQLKLIDNDPGYRWTIRVETVAGDPNALNVSWDALKGATHYLVSSPSKKNEVWTRGTSHRYVHLERNTTHTVTVEAWRQSYHPFVKLAESTVSATLGSTAPPAPTAPPGEPNAAAPVNLSVSATGLVTWQAGSPAETNRKYYIRWASGDAPPPRYQYDGIAGYGESRLCAASGACSFQIEGWNSSRHYEVGVQTRHEPEFPNADDWVWARYMPDSAGPPADRPVQPPGGVIGGGGPSPGPAFVVFLPASNDAVAQRRLNQGNVLIVKAGLEYRSVALGDTDPDVTRPVGARLPRWYRIDGESHDGRTWGGLRWLRAMLDE